MPRNLNAFKHGGTGRRSYKSWSHMVRRCTNPSDEAWPNYGGRGVKVCDRWLHSYANFRDDMGEPPAGDYSIDKDKLGDGMLYSPETCCWLPRHEQSRNKRTNIMLTFKGQTMCLTDWAKKIGISKGALGARIRSGWPLEKALTAPVKPGLRPF